MNFCPCLHHLLPYFVETQTKGCPRSASEKFVKFRANFVKTRTRGSPRNAAEKLSVSCKSAQGGGSYFFLWA